VILGAPTMNIQSLTIPGLALIVSILSFGVSAYNWWTTKQFQDATRKFQEDTVKSQETTKKSQETTKRFQDTQRKDELIKAFHIARDANFDEEISPERYFINFWTVQNQQIRLWDEQIFSDEEFASYLNFRIREFKGVAKMPVFEYLKKHPQENSRFNDYSDYEKAWNTVSERYKGYRLYAVMNDVKARMYNNETFDEDKVAKLRENVKNFLI
jgi:hypothetical protein